MLTTLPRALARHHKAASDVAAILSERGVAVLGLDGGHREDGAFWLPSLRGLGARGLWRASSW